MINLLLLLACAGQFSVDVVPTFTVSVAEEKPAAKPVAAQKRKSLAYFRGKYCGPCVRWSHKEKSKLKAAGVSIQEYNTDEGNVAERFAIGSVPTFIILDWETGAWIGEPIVGYTSAESLLKKMDSTSSVPAAGASSSSGTSAQSVGKSCNCTEECSCGCNRGEVCECKATPVSAVSAMSHSDMVSLHNRLHGGGSHSWPGDLRTHLRQTHGVATEF